MRVVKVNFIVCKVVQGKHDFPSHEALWKMLYNILEAKTMDYLIAIFLVVCSTLLTLAVQRSSGKSTKNKEFILKKPKK